MSEPDLMTPFDTLKDEFYPGSKMLRRESLETVRERKKDERRQELADESWDAHPKKKSYRGVEYEMFNIGAFGKAMGKSPVTLRAWIRKGWLPRNQFQDPPVIGSRGDAGRRLWTRAQIERIVAIAREEGLLEQSLPRIQQTNFTQRITDEWKDLRWR